MDDLTEDESRMLALIEAQHDFPGPFLFKAIYKNQPALAESIVAAIQGATGLELAVDPPRINPSKTGKFVSLTMEFTIPEPRQVLRVYRVLAKLESVLSYF